MIYYFYDERNRLCAIFLYGENEKANFRPEQEKKVASLAATIKAAAKAHRSKLRREGPGRPPSTCSCSRSKWMDARFGLRLA